MAESAVEKFGIELLLASLGKDIQSPEEKCVVYAHWALLLAGYRCIGLGDAKELTGDETITELLPKEWDKGPNHLLRYLNKKKQLYLLKINSMGNDVIISLIRAEDMKITSMAHSLEPKDEKKDWNKFADEFSKAVVEPLQPKKTPQTCTLETVRPRASLPDDYFGVAGPGFGGMPPGFPVVGGTDLDPLGRYGPGGPAGMIFRPGSSRSGFPGIRHDPILPGRGPRGRPPGPDPDHFQPPGFNNDYYM